MSFSPKSAIRALLATAMGRRVFILGSLALIGPLVGCRSSHVAKEHPEIPGFIYLGTNEAELHEYRHQQTGIEFVLLTGGSFLMGGTPEEHARVLAAVPAEGKALLGEEIVEDIARELEAETPLRRIRVGAFLMGKHEVRQREWSRIQEALDAGYGADSDLPVSGVSLRDCQAFLSRTRPRLGLPSEAQWEYACRGGGASAYGFGDELSQEAANYGGSAMGQVLPDAGLVAVDRFRPNGFGLFGFHGNVGEWCQTVDGARDDAAESGETDPVAATPNVAVVRGGGFLSSAADCRCASRQVYPPEWRQEDIGFRVVFTEIPD